MPADILISDVTNAEDTGVFDVLMAAVNADIDEQYLNNRITGSDFAKVKLGSIQAVLAESIKFVLQEKLLEAQINDSEASTALKDEQTKLAYTQRVAQDKAVAKLGLDNVMRQSEVSRDGSEEFVYTPRYEDTV